MKKYFVFQVFTLLLFSSFIFGQNSAEIIKVGDELTDAFKNNEALEKYLEAEKIDKDNWEILWRLSRTYINIAEHMPTETDAQEDEQYKKYEIALEYADKAVKLAPNKSITYVRRAIANGRIALFKGIFSVAEIVNSVKADCDEAIRLNNGGNFVQGLAHYILGRTHSRLSEKWAPARSVLGLGWGDIEVSFVEFDKAIALRDDFIMFYLDYAKALLKEDEYDKAREKLQKLITLPKEDEDDVARIDEAKKMLKEIEDE